MRNYQLYGAAKLGFLQVINPGPVLPDAYHIYTHHPPSIVWVSSLGSIFFGLNEASLRFVTASATLVSIVALYVLVRRLFGQAWAWKSAALYALNPMVAYFGRMPSHDVLSLSVGLMFAVVLVNWMRRPTRGRSVALAALAWIAVWTAWSTILYVGALGLVGIVMGNRKQRKIMIGIGALTLLSLTVLIAFYWLQKPGFYSDIKSAFLWRASSQTLRPGSVQFTWLQFATRFISTLLAFGAPALVIIGLMGVLPAFRRASRLGIGILAALFAVGIGYTLIFRNAVFIHEFLELFLLPPLAITAGLVFENRRRFVRPALSGLILASLIVGASNLIVLHKSGQGPCCSKFAEALNRNSATDDLIMSNLPSIASANEYYAFRTVQWDTPPDIALARGSTAQSAAIYVYCDALDYSVSNGLLTISEAAISPQPPAAPPDALADLPHTVDGGCLFFELG